MTNDPSTPNSDDASLPAEMPQEWEALMAGDGSRIVSDARVVRIADGAAWFDIGSKLESPIPLTDWEYEDPPKVGDRYSILIDEDCDVADRPLKIIRGRVHVDRQGIWQRALASLSVGQQCTGRLTHRITDGFLVDIGVHAFLSDGSVPAEMCENPDAFLDQKIHCHVTSIDPERREIRVAMEENPDQR